MSTPTLLVQLDNGTGTFPYNITTYVRVDQTITTTRGRPDEGPDIDASELSLRLDNPDGRFTLGNPTYGVRRGQRIRLTLTVGATTIQRFTGYVRDWPTTFAGPRAVMAVVRISATDRQALLSRRELRTILEEEVALDNPLAYYTLTEAEGAIAGGDTSGNGQRPLAQVGAGAAVSFGTGTGPGIEDTKAVQIAGGKFLRAQLTPGVAQVSLILECRFARFGNPAIGQLDVVARLYNPAGTQKIAELAINASGSLELNTTVAGITPIGWATAGAVTDGAWHHAALVLTGTGDMYCYVDGALIATSSGGAGSPPAPGTLDVGGDRTGAYATSQLNVAHVAVYNESQAPFSWARGLERYAAQTGFAGERSDQRIARLAAYAGVPSADMALETGVEILAGQTTTGVRALDAIRAAARAEGGPVFLRGDGKLVAQNRTHRVIAATGTPAAVINGDDGTIDWDDLVISNDDQYVVNVAEGSRVGGASLRAVNKTSVAAEGGEYPASFSGVLVTTDDDVLDLLQWTVGMYGDPGVRMAQVTIDLLTASSALTEAVLALELGDYFRVPNLPALSPLATAELIVEGLREELSLTEWSITFNTVPAPLFRAWVLGDATYGVLGITTRLHY